jgi:hypothetical protein
MVLIQVLANPAIGQQGTRVDGQPQFTARQNVTMRHCGFQRPIRAATVRERSFSGSLTL